MNDKSRFEEEFDNLFKLDEFDFSESSEKIKSFIADKIAQAKRQERERILEEMKKQYAPPLYTNDGRRGYDSCLSDLTNIINNHD